MNNRRWRFLSIFIITALMFSSLAGINLHTARADVQNTQVTPYPRQAGEKASYSIKANINAALNAGTDSISVIFPKPTLIDSMISSANISVNPRRLIGADFEMDYARGAITLLAPLQRGDRLSVTYRYDPGVAFTGLPRNVKFYDQTFLAGDARHANGILDPGEWVYEDRNTNNRIDVGDRRLSTVIFDRAGTRRVYKAGSIVQNDDWDMSTTETRPLTNYPVTNLKFVDTDNDGTYSENDWLVDDRDSNDLISTGDRIIAGQYTYIAGTTVSQFDLDRFTQADPTLEVGANNLPTIDVALRYHDANGNTRYDEGESIYRKIGAILTEVQGDDIRLTWVYRNSQFYARNSRVQSRAVGDTQDDTDLRLPLREFVNNAPTRQETTYDDPNYLLDYYQTIYSHVGIAVGPAPNGIFVGDTRLSSARRSAFQPQVATVISAGPNIDPDVGHALVTFADNERFAGFGPGYRLHDPIYRVNENTNSVSENHIRLTDVIVWLGNVRVLYTAGSTVRKGELDIGTTLQPMPNNIRHTELGVPNSRFDIGELIYRSISNTVSNTDIRFNFIGIQSANLTVPANYPDSGRTLTRGWTEITQELTGFANGGETQFPLNNKPVVRPVVPIPNDSRHLLTQLTIPGVGNTFPRGKYWYVITALNDAIGESDSWEEKSVEFAQGTTANAVRIEWSPVPNADRYRIYRTMDEGTWDESNLVAQVAAPMTQYIDFGGESLPGIPPTVYNSSFTNLTRIRNGNAVRLTEYELADYRLDLQSGNVTFRRPLKQYSTIVADYNRGVKVINESIVFDALMGRGATRHGNVLDPAIYGDEVYPLKLKRYSAANPDDPTTLVRGIDFEFEDDQRNRTEGLRLGQITFYIQLLASDKIQAEYSYKKEVRGDMILVTTTPNQTNARTSEGNIIANSDRIMRGRTLSSAPVINVMNSEKGPLITFTTPVNVKPNPANKLNITPDSPRDLNITFSLQIGIRNPDLAANYQVFMKTSKEQTETLSDPYQIIAKEEGQQLIKLTRDQQVEAGSSIALATTVQDELGNNIPNVNVVYSLVRSPESMAKLDKSNFITDASGKAVAMLTTSPNPGENVVEARIAGTNRSVLFTITGLSSSPISQVTITPDTAIMTPRGTRQFRATGLDANGNIVPNITFSWTVDPTNLGSIDQNGNFTASDAVGSGMIHAEAYGIRGSAVVTIGTTPPEEIATIQIDPTSATVAVNQSRQFTAIARDQNNQIIPGVSFNWTITPADLGVISANGLFTAGRKGTGVVIASAGGKQAIAAVTVSDNIGRIEINPSSATVKRNEIVQFYAMVYDTNNQIITVPVTWAVTGGIGIITQTGIFTATSAGNGQVTATAGSVQTSVPVMVTDQMPGDTEGPDIQISFPSPNQSIADSNIIVRGTVRDPSGIKQVTVNNALATYDPVNHTFASQPVMLSAGTNNITITAEDTLGNISTKTVQVVKASSTIIKLAIGSSFAGVTRDGQMQMMRLDVAPFLQSGRTMVPLRFIAEAFGAEVKWHADPSGTGDGGIEIILMKANGTRIVIKMHTTSKTVIIETYAPGSYQAQTTRYEMEVRPFVVKPQGRTVVPIRFIAEGFGAEVQWEASTQEITITMMP